MSPESVQLILAVFGASGLLGAIIAVVKLRPEGNERAVQTSLNAVSAVDTVLDELRSQLVDRKREVEMLHGDLEACRARERALEVRADEWRERALSAEDQLRGGGPR